MRRVTARSCVFTDAFVGASDWIGKAHVRRVDFASYEEFRKYSPEPL